MTKLALSLFFIFSTTLSLSASSNNTQTFELIYFLAGDSTTIIYQENIMGAVADPPGVTYQHTISILTDDSVIAGISVVSNKKDKPEFPESDSLVLVVESEGVYKLPGGGGFVLPENDSTFAHRHNAFRPKYWYSNCIKDCLRDLAFTETSAKRLYFDPHGVYINYKIKFAYYNIATKLLIILTDQPHMASGFDTMHGVLIYRLTK